MSYEKELSLSVEVGKPNAEGQVSYTVKIQRQGRRTKRYQIPAKNIDGAISIALDQYMTECKRGTGNEGSATFLTAAEERQAK